MSLQYEDSVLDFDLDFFHQTQTSNSVVTPEKLKDKNEKCRNPITVAKRKIVATDSLIRKYYSKREELDQLEKTLYSSKEECKKVCIDFQNVTERCNRLDAEAQVLRNVNQQLQEKCMLAESRVDALQSHAHQLQTLVKENETLIEGMKVEHQLEKPNIKDYEKKLTTHQKENDNLMKHIYLLKDVILGRKKLNRHVKDILSKYKSKYESDDNDSVLGGVDSDDDNYFESPKTPEDTYKEEPNNSTQPSGKNYVGKVEPVVAKSDNDLDSDFNHERASADTGRGSSLAYSDSDKCFNSPDYFMESSPLDTNITEKIRTNVVDIATSPIHIHEFVNSSTSPMAVKQSVHTSTSPMSGYIAREASDSPKPRKKYETLSGISPLTTKQVENTSERITCGHTDDSVSEDIDNITHEYSQKEFLELNNSNNFDDHESRDGEIESILSKMRMTHSLITPIPTTPSKSQHSSSSCTSAAKDTDLCINNFVCKDALKVKEENVILKTNIMKLASEIESIKEMLKITHLPHQLHPKTENTIECDYYEEDLILVPGEMNCTEISESVESVERSSVPWNENQSIETALLNNIDSRKGIKRLEFEEPLELSSQPVEEKEFEVEDASDTKNTSQNINCPIRKSHKHRKLTKLERLRQKLIPTNKIKTNISPLRRIKNKKAVRKINNKSAAALNNKKAYEKAVKIISELKLKEKKVNPKVAKKIDKQCFKKIDILDDILGVGIRTKSPSAVPRPKENTPCKEVNQECLQDQQNTSIQNCNRIIILEDILLTKPQTLTIKDLTQSTPSPVKSDDLLDSTTTKTLENEYDASQCKTIQEEDKKQLPIHSEESNTQDCYESKKTQDTDQIIVQQQINCDTNYTKSMEIPTKINTDDSNITINKLNKIDKKEQKEFESPIVQSIESCRTLIATRSRTKVVEHEDTVKDSKSVISDKLITQSNPQNDVCLENNNDAKNNLQQQKQRTRKRQKRIFSEKPDFECKRMLRSSTSRFSSPNESNIGLSKSQNLEPVEAVSNILLVNTEEKSKTVLKDEKQIRTEENVVSYNDIEMFEETSETHHNVLEGVNNKPSYVHPKHSVISDKLITQSNPQNDVCLENNKDAKSNLQQQQRKRKRQNRTSCEKPDFECKRIHSLTSRFSSSNESDLGLSKSQNLEPVEAVSNILPVNTEEKSKTVLKDAKQIRTEENVSYNDIKMFGESSEANHNLLDGENNKPSYVHPKDSILCVMIDKHGKQSMKDFSKRVPDSVVNTISKTIEDEITTVIESSSKDAKKQMNKFVETIEKWDYRQFMAGLMNYLNNPQRKLELFNKVSLPSVPPMTKAEQILLYVIAQLKNIWTSTIDFVDCLLRNIEYVLFKLNQTPEFDIIESMSHFYAITCRYFKMKSRLRIFMLDAMYCIQFKAIPVIKQCMEVWMHVLPLAHMGIAKSPLVTCMVYLLHFYKCDDRFNRVQDIRYLLSRKYFYEITEWNDSKIIEMFRNAIKDVRVIPLEMKLLRVALIIIAKRYGPQWCQKHIIKNLMLPMIESDAYPERVKVFCVSVLGALMKPYPVEMRVHYEIIINMLVDMLDQNPSPKMEEAIFTSLICMSRHSYNRVLQTLLTWKPQQISPEFENVIRDFVREKSLNTWKAILCKLSVI